jgi:branched-chain amino acid transport system ATP-binding protein
MRGCGRSILATPDAVRAALPTDAMLSVANLQVNYGVVAAIKGISLDVMPGEVVALLGANGAGKTTMLRTISGLIRPRAGTITFAGERIGRMAPARIVRHGIAHSPEGRRVFGSLTVAENLRLGASARLERETIEEDRERIYALFPILRERMHQQAGTLSGGEQQMLALGRALMAKPKLLLLDEPSLGLAPLIIVDIFKALADLKANGVTMLLVEQNIATALNLADRAYVLRTGEIALSGPARELSDNYEEVAAAYLGARQ